MASGLGSLPDYLASLGTPTADVGGGGLNLGSLLGQGGGGLGGALGGLGGIGNLFSGIQGLMQGGAGGDLSGALDLASIPAMFIPVVGPILSALMPMLGNMLGPMIQGLPANVKPEMFANYMQGQGGLAGVMGDLINAAQQKAGSGTGILSQAGAGAYNPNFDATLLEALTGQNLGAVDPKTGRQVFTAPPTGGVKNPVSLSFLPESSLMASAPMAGLKAYGYTPAQLSSPTALKAIESATNYGMVGTGEGLGTTKVAQYLPKVVAALQAAGIQPGQDTSGSTGTTGTGDGSGKGGTLNLNDLLGLLGKLGGGGGGGGGSQGGDGTGSGGGNPLDILKQLFGGPTQTQQANPTINFNPSHGSYLSLGQGYSGTGIASPAGGPQVQRNPLGNFSSQAPQINIPAMQPQNVMAPQAPMVQPQPQQLNAQSLSSLLGSAASQPWSLAA